jgi:hypothetical protein
MACSSCNGGKSNSNPPSYSQGLPLSKNSVASNFIKAVKTQPNKLKWFKDGVKGILKCIGHIQIYDDLGVQNNRDVCRLCDQSSKPNGKLTAASQCMAIDPETNAPCACFILCKTQSGKCPIGKWTSLTINNK